MREVNADIVKNISVMQSDVSSDKTNNNDKDRKQEPLHLTKENSLQSSPHIEQVPPPDQKSDGSLATDSSSEQSSGSHASSSIRSGGRSEVRFHIFREYALFFFFSFLFSTFCLCFSKP